MKNVMKKAWEIARKGQENFGGQVKEYFAQALRMAWAIIKKGVEKMNGTEKQVKWAKDIQKRMNQHLDAFEVNARGESISDDKKKQVIRYVELMREEIESVKEATTLINHKEVLEVTESRNAIQVIGKMIDMNKVQNQVAKEFS